MSRFHHQDRTAATLARAEEIVRNQQAARAARPGTGVSWSAMTTPAAEVETVDAVVSRLIADEARQAAYAASPEGRFRAAVYLIYKATGDERLLQCVSCGLETNADWAEHLLTTMGGPAAEAARMALADYAGRRAAA